MNIKVSCQAWIGGEFRGEWIPVCVWLSPFAVHLKLSQPYLLIGYTPIQNKFSKNYIYIYINVYIIK